MKLQPEFVESLSGYVELELSPDRISFLSEELSDMVGRIRNGHHVDLTGISPVVTFCAAWGGLD